MLRPDECTGLADIRHAIDTLDHEMVTLLGKRMGYVLAASRFKPNEQSIPAPDRVASMLEARRRWAKENGLDSDFVESLFEHLIPWFIARQVEYWRSRRGQA
ncbi:Chorismate mutase related enzyme [Alloalcanivorax dieselolei B5]|uniref:chorismate mutase n=1 Tax=Alcanivorax dieselolei (strain DSM 16502 / CGMCC 1.3690 / MCCC 1A00001 / B-5) TaxID=930169 RepID=K0CB82_ALCDB|nr:isochorismate lyase [Alloalcanivorax dieselolei]AFT70774.1 Chorismate mutase related enzyme [Alloalcanivorax dieselolei B5]GGJ97637.1 isochorismate pyruvate lyase [Alloalcanivorax dieselolei]